MLGGIFGRKAGGSALKGEDKVSCAMRELLEETGISSNDLKEISCYTSHDTIYYCFLCVTDCDKTSITLPVSITVCDFYTADRLAEVDNKNYIQLRNNVLV